MKKVLLIDGKAKGKVLHLYDEMSRVRVPIYEEESHFSLANMQAPVKNKTIDVEDYLVFEHANGVYLGISGNVPLTQAVIIEALYNTAIEQDES